MATWSSKLTKAAFEAVNGVTQAQFLRSRHVTNDLIYVLAIAKKADLSLSAFVARSPNRGSSWSSSEVAGITSPGAGFSLGATVDHGGYHGAAFFGRAGGDVTFETLFDGEENWQNVSTDVQLILDDPLPEGNLTLEYDVVGACPSKNYDMNGDQPPQIDYLTYDPVVTGSFSGSPGSYHFTGHIDTARASKTILTLGWTYTSSGRWENQQAGRQNGTFKNLVIGGVAYGGGIPCALDVPPGNTNWVYVGLVDKIMKSEDGAFTWLEPLVTGRGANDICCDPQAAGAFYYFDTSGYLNLMVNGVDTNTNLLGTAETPLQVPLRIARDPSSGKLWAIPNGTELKMRNDGSWTSQKTGLSMGRGLHAYPGQKLCMVDGSDIWVSNNSGATWEAKKGASGYSNGLNAHRIVSS